MDSEILKLKQRICTVKGYHSFKVILQFLAILASFYGCTKDGQDGKAFIAFDWDYTVDNYWDNNPNIPSSISRNYAYQTSPGSFSYEYNCSNGTGMTWGYQGTYTIEVNLGEDATLLKNGEDGSDRNYNFFLSASGPSLNTSAKSKSTLNQLDFQPRNSLKKPIYRSSQIRYLSPIVYHDTIILPEYTLTLTQQYFDYQN